MKIGEACAVVTGGTSGLGRAVAEHVVAHGGKVVVLDVQQMDASAEPETRKGSIEFLRCDVTSESEVRTAMAAACAHMGSINILVNCAGVIGAGRLLGREGPARAEGFFRTIQINLLGTLNCDKEAAALMLANVPGVQGERGVLIHVSSVAAYDGQIGQVAYSATKAAVAGTVLPIARELAGYGIRCVGIAPGVFRTPMVAAMKAELQESLGRQVPFPSRLGEPEEFAQLVSNVFELSYLNGETIRLDGGIRMQAK